jgi:glyoxylase-like metal-dependent hydrolase (beta-lactamase superfamily II)
MKILCVDCNYVQKEFASSYLLIHEGRGFFVECNTSHAIPLLLKAAEENGIPRENVDGLLITHVHLDHAGGAGVFLREFPNAKLYAHPRAARHAIDPSRLIASATQVYGEEFMKRVYGEILPCDAARVVVLNDVTDSPIESSPVSGDEIHWRGKKILTKHVRGHANHHLAAIEPESKTLFSGDAFGVSYPEIDRKAKSVGTLVITPSSSPTDFDSSAAINAVKWIAAQRPSQIALTHYSFLPASDVPEASTQLIAQLEFFESLLQKTKANQLPEAEVFSELKAWVTQFYVQKKLILDSADLEYLDLDLKVNAQGLHYSATKKV